MKPIFHPSISDVRLEQILHALTDPVRLEIFVSMLQDEGQKCATYVNVQGRKLAKSSLSQHLRVLRDAGLIRSERAGNEMRNTTRCSELKDKYGNLLNAILQSYALQNEASKAVAKTSKKKLS